MSDQFVAEIRIVAYNFAMTGWAKCNGQLIPISQNTALFSLLGTMYGGDGKSTFALPNMQGSTPLHKGQGPGLSMYDQGQIGGSQFITLLNSEIPAHTHNVMTANAAGDINVPTGNLMARSSNGSVYLASGTPSTQLHVQALGITGASLPHNNMQPYITLNFLIAMQGIFPSMG